ncbi:MAG TPA: hypothetical protein VK879_16840 [Candidatus Sulfomarinibacteraceae bacterium]|nr:hypothetical protein [Candidatus Sulfomarinibacteraceae bacterium]
MSQMKVNEQAVAKARELIKQHQYDKESDWSEAQPSTSQENDFLEKHDWDEYGQWFLAIDTDASEETKDRYNFPYGDFRRVHRDGLIAAKQRAAQYDHSDVEQAADDLLQLLDETMSKGA